MHARLQLGLLLGGALLVASSAGADVVISKNPTLNMNCQSGTCSPTASSAVLNTTDLAAMLASGDVKVATGSGATNITVKDTVSWASTSRLALDANQSVTIEKPVMVTGTGAVTITTDDGGTGGDFTFHGKGRMAFWDLTSSLIVNGNSYTLIGDIDTLSAAIAINSSGDYALANNFDAEKKTYRGSPITTIFYGQFEGLGNSISNFSMKDVTGNQQQDYEGLFSWITSGATVENLNLLHVKISAKSPCANEVMGALAGYNEGSMINDSVSGKIDGNTNQNAIDNIGGLIGRNDGLVVRSRSSANITYGDTAGGLIGLNSGTLSDSSASGTVDSAGNAGGLVGGAGTLGGQGGIANSFATGAVSNSKVPSWLEGYLGGLVGSNTGMVANSFATGSVTEFNTSTTGGLFGHNEGSVTSSYATGAEGSDCRCGGVTGEDVGGTYKSIYWDLDTSGQSQGCGEDGNCSGITGLSDPQLKSGLPKGFDKKVWKSNSNINNGYPYLIANPPPK